MNTQWQPKARWYTCYTDNYGVVEYSIIDWPATEILVTEK